MTETLTTQESAYFESGGAEPIPASPPAQTATETPPASPPAAAPVAGQVPAAEEGAGEGGKGVPIGALQEERRKRQLAQDEAAAMRQELAELKAWRQQLEAERKPKEPAIPALDQDPVGHLSAKLQGTEKTLAEMQAARQREEQAQQIRGQAEQISQRAGALESEFKAKTPDYDAAMDYLRGQRMKELSAIYGEGAPQVQQALQNDIHMLAISAISLNRNPAEVAYNLAVARGYTAKQPDPPPVEHAAAALARVAAGQERGKGIGGAPGAPAGKPALETALKMGDKQFASLDDDEFRRLAGG